jgi:hypothetical protein
MVTICQGDLVHGPLTPSVKWEMGFSGVPQQEPARQSEHSHVCLHRHKSDVDGIIYREYTEQYPSTYLTRSPDFYTALLKHHLLQINQLHER